MAARRRLIDHLEQSYDSVDREELLARIVCGETFVDGERIRRPDHLVDEGCAIEFRRESYVSRGGTKLEHGLAFWNIRPKGKVFLDAGSSTGGFTDCLLQHGAIAVHAVDTGYNQLDFRLRRDSRVVVHERTSIVDVESLEPRPHAAVADLSLRSISGIAHHILELTSEGWGIMLLKPQYEQELRNRSTGVVSPDDLGPIVVRVVESLSAEGVSVLGLLRSPILGRSGNTEFLALVETTWPGTAPPDPRLLVSAALSGEPSGRLPGDYPNESRPSGSPT